MNINTENLFAIVINLPKDTKRKAFMESELNTLKIPYSILEATDGRAFDFKDEYKEDEAIRKNGRPLTPPEQGCAHSHKRALQAFLSSGKEYGLIMEDDVVIDERLLKGIAYALSKKEAWNYVQFNYSPIGIEGIRLWWFLVRKDPAQKGLRFLLTLFKGIGLIIVKALWGMREALYSMLGMQALAHLYRDQYLAGCYLLTKEAAEAIVDLNTPLTYAADRVQNIARNEGRIQERIYIPRIVRQKRESFTSSINNDHFGEAIISA